MNNTYKQGVKHFDFEYQQEIERNILTALLMSDKAYELLYVIWSGAENTTNDLAELFENTFYSEVFTELWDMYKSNEKIDPVTLKNRLSEEVKLSDIMDIMKDSTSHSSDTHTVMINGYALWGMYWEGIRISCTIVD